MGAQGEDSPVNVAAADAHRKLTVPNPSVCTAKLATEIDLLMRQSISFLIFMQNRMKLKPPPC